MLNHHPQPAGFTLLELMIVLSLVSIITGIGALSHRAMRPGLELSAATRQVVMDLKLARMRAATQGVGHRIVFPDGGVRYQPQRQGSNGSYTDAGTSVPLPQGIQIADCSANSDAIGFRPRGNAASFGTVTLRNSRGDVRQVIVNINGQVRVQ